MQRVEASALGFVVRATQVEATAVRVQGAGLWELLYRTVGCNGIASPSVVNATSRSSSVGFCCQIIWESIFVVVECCRVSDVFFLLTNLDPNVGVTHVRIGYCITSSDILIRIQILLTEDACWN